MLTTVHTDMRVRVLLGVIATTIVLLVAAACGGGSGTTASAKGADAKVTITAPAGCLDQLVTLANSDIVKKTMDDGGTPASLEGQFTDFTENCGDTLATLTPEQTSDLLSKIDPSVAMWLAQGLG